MALIEIIGPISGAHVNPAVSIGFYLQKSLTGLKTIGYVLAQCVGALLASLLYKVWFPQSETLGATLPNGPI